MLKIKDFKAPRASFIKTKDLEKVKKLNDLIVHIYGFSGTGKTQICRAISQEKSKANNPHVIWSTQCSSQDAEGESALLKHWKWLIEKLSLEGKVSGMDKVRVCEDLQQNNGRTFVQLLQNLEVPVFLVVEDVSQREKELLKSVVNSLHSSKLESVRLMIVTQNKDDIFPDCDIAEMSQYQTFQVSGFTEEEAAAFLQENRRNKDLEGVRNLAKSLRFSPLHLTLAKSYCDEHNESYSNYFANLGLRPEVVEKEKKFLERHPEVGKSHAYEVIMKSLKGKDENDQEEKRMFEVIKFLAFLEHEDIPDFLLGRYYRQLYDTDDEGERLFVAHLIHKLERCQIFTVRDEAKQYGQRLMSTHKVIFLAIGMSMSDNEKKKVVENGLKALNRTKDSRMLRDQVKLAKMMNHVGSFVGKLLKYFNSNFETHKYEDFEIQIGLSELYELLGFINAQQGENEGEKIGKGLLSFWKLVCRYEKEFWLGMGKNRTERHDDLLKYTNGKDPSEVAHRASEIIKCALHKIPQEFVVKHYSVFAPVTVETLKEMKSSEKAKLHDIDWEDLKTTLIERQQRSERQLSDDQIELLRNNQFLLTPQQLHQTFILERISSMLHTKSRLLLNIKYDITEEEEKSYEWYREVGIQISSKIPEFGGIHSLLEYILVANNKLARMVQSRDNESDEDLLKRLDEVCRVAEDLSKVKDVFYENGIFKNVTGTPYTVMNIKKYIVKAITKLHKRPDLAARVLIGGKRDDALKVCDELYTLARENPHVSVAANCRVQVGKLFGALGLYAQAVEAIDSGFNLNGYGINKVLQSRTATYAWALYNYGMAICKGGTTVPDFDKHKRKFRSKLELVKIQFIGNPKLSATWEEKLMYWDRCMSVIQ